MKKQSLVYITRPLELIGAIEAREHFGISNAVLVINFDKVDVNTHKFLLEHYPVWDEIIWLELDGTYYGERWVQLLKKLRKNEYEYFLSRSFRTASYFVHNLKYEKMYLLDDGSATINIHKSLLKEKNLTNRFHLFKGEENDEVRSKQKKIMLRYWFRGVKVSGPVTNVNFFTFYEINSNDYCTVVKNSFTWLNRFKTDKIKIRKNVVYFIGNNAINEGVIKYYDYLETLIKVKEKFKNKELYYLPHPNENEGFSKLIESGLGYKIKKNKINIELSFLMENQVPEIITGTVSTALTTLSFLYGDMISVEYFNFNMNKISQRWFTQIKAMYEYQKEKLKEHVLNYD